MPISSAIPTVATAIPALITVRGPNRPTAFGASVEATKIERVIGRKHSPASIAS